MDRNPGVRMKAIEALQGFEQDPEVRQALFNALQSDDNSGVRVEAINILLNALRSGNTFVASDPRMLEVLRDRLRNDPNNYVRLQSQAALRELGSADRP
jgi:HEAT repeat protein